LAVADIRITMSEYYKTKLNKRYLHPLTSHLTPADHQ